MRVLLINSVCGIGSTGRICTDLAQQFEKDGHEVKIAYGRDGFVPEQFQKYAVRIGNDLDVKLHGLRTRLLDEHGFGSVRATKEFLKWADAYDPDLVWLHNIHGYYLNVELLFEWIKSRPDMKVKWTLHDCWAFTGHCTHFEPIGCEKWKTQCQNCQLKKDYPKSCFFNHSKSNYLRKKNAFLGVKHMMLVTPSKWLMDMVKQSYLKDYHVITIPNEINTQIFHPIDKNETFQKKKELSDKYGIDFSKRIFLGVASVWTKEKGLEDLIKIAGMDQNEVQVVLVGVSKEQKKKLPPYVIGIVRTENQAELAMLYTCADVFLNPTYADTFPTVNIEAKACGLPVISYRTGGSTETADVIVEQGDWEKMFYHAVKLHGCFEKLR